MPKKVASATKQQTSVLEKKVRATSVSTARKLGRNSDGTFRTGNKESVGNNGGRPAECLSFRQQMKIRVQKDPKILDKALDTLIGIANDPDHPKCADAIDKLIKLNGNYDPAETKDVTPTAPDRPLKGLSIQEVREALALKRGKKK
ncbi:hypothetical protein LJC07_04710 [Christensenellaceae bacterium OttesenSCG-928-L17]|nr:hypothetical protein [Christensenellaceae bacterium OttesenSCG-928-L17]